MDVEERWPASPDSLQAIRDRLAGEPRAMLGRAMDAFVSCFDRLLTADCIDVAGMRQTDAVSSPLFLLHPDTLMNLQREELL